MEIRYNVTGLAELALSGGGARGLLSGIGIHEPVLNIGAAAGIAAAVESTDYAITARIECIMREYRKNSIHSIGFRMYTIFFIRLIVV